MYTIKNRKKITRRNDSYKNDRFDHFFTSENKKRRKWRSLPNFLFYFHKNINNFCFLAVFKLSSRFTLEIKDVPNVSMIRLWLEQSKTSSSLRVYLNWAGFVEIQKQKQKKESWILKLSCRHFTFTLFLTKKTEQLLQTTKFIHNSDFSLPYR